MKKLNIIIIVFFNCIFLKSIAQVPNISYPSGNKIFYVGAPILPISINNSGGTMPNTLYGEVSSYLDTMSFNNLGGIVKDKQGNLYVTEYISKTGGHIISKIDINGYKTIYAGTGVQGSLDTIRQFATFRSPTGLAIDSIGNIYVADYYNHKIRKISTQGYVSTYSGNGIAGSTNGTLSEASFNNPFNLIIDKNETFYISDYGNNKIRKIYNGIVSTYAGNGTAGSIDAPTTTASFKNPRGLAIDNAGVLYIADVGNHKIRKINTNGLVTTYAGNGYAGKIDSTLITSSFNSPIDVALDQFGNLFVSDFGNNCVRVIEKIGFVRTIAGSISGYENGIGLNAKFNSPYSITMDTLENFLFVIDNVSKIRKIKTLGYSIFPNLPNGLVFENNGTISGTPLLSKPLKSYIVKALNKWGLSSTTLNIGVVSGNANIKSFTISSSYNVFPSIHADTNNYYTYVYDNGNSFYIKVFSEDSNATIEVKLNSGAFTKLAYGAFSSNFTMGLGTNKIYIKITSLDSFYSRTYELNVTKLKEPKTTYPITAEQVNLVVGRKITPILPINTGGLPEPVKVLNTRVTNKLKGSIDSTIKFSSFNTPSGLAFDRIGNLFIADQFNHKIRKIDTNGVVSTYAGTGEIGSTDDSSHLATFNNPFDVVVDSIGNVFVTDIYNHKIRKISPFGIVTTFAGTGFVGNNDGLGNTAGFSYPNGITCDKFGNVYVADQGNNLIRKISQNGIVTTLAGNGVAGFKDTLSNYASFNSPSDLAVDSFGNIYVADKLNNRIRKILPNGNVITHLGNGVLDNNFDQNGKLNSIYKPENIVIDKSGNLYIASPTPTYFKIIFNSSTNYNSIFFENKDAYEVLNGIAIDKNGDFYSTITYANLYSINKLEKGVAYSVNPELPSGLILNKVTGEISGTPKDIFSLRSFTITSYNRVALYSASSNFVINLACYPKSNNSKLTKLSLRALDLVNQTTLVNFTLNPIFNPDSFNYKIKNNLSTYYNTLFLSLATANKASSIQIKVNNNNYFVSRIDSVLGDEIKIEEGLNTIFIKTTASDDVTFSIDTITLFRDYSGVSIENISSNLLQTISINPNPFNEKVNISFYSNDKKEVEIEIIDAVGRKVYNHIVKTKIGKNSIELSDLELLKVGFYNLTFKTEDGFIKTIKLVKN